MIWINFRPTKLEVAVLTSFLPGFITILCQRIKPFADASGSGFLLTASGRGLATYLIYVTVLEIVCKALDLDRKFIASFSVEK